MRSSHDGWMVTKAAVPSESASMRPRTLVMVTGLLAHQHEMGMPAAFAGNRLRGVAIERTARARVLRPGKLAQRGNGRERFEIEGKLAWHGRAREIVWTGRGSTHSRTHAFNP